MKKVLLLGASIATLVCSSALALNVGIVDIQALASSPDGFSKIQAKIENQYTGQRNDLMKQMQQIQAEQKDIEKNKAVWPKDKLDAANAKLKDEQQKFQTAQATYQRSVMTAQQEEMKSFFEKIKSAAGATAKKDNLDAVFVNASVLYVKDSKDVTQDVLSNMK